MQEYITELSKYIIAALMVLYTLSAFLPLWSKWERKTAVYVAQNILMFLVQLIMFTVLVLVSGQMEYLFFYVFVQVFLLAASLMVPIIYENTNRLLLNNMCMLSGIGLCVISRLSFRKAVRQYVIVLLSLAISLLIPWLLFQVRFLKKLTWGYGALGALALGAVFLLSETTYGSELSFTLGSVTFQPSEFVKILFVFFLAGALWDTVSFGRIALTAVVAGLHVILLVLSKDLGSALIFFVGYVFVVFAATKNYLYLLAGFAGGSGAAWGAYLLFAHVRDRVVTWKNPWSYIVDEGFSVTQSLFGIGSGSWFGMGLLQGNPTAIPFVEKDFIFSSVSEELGVVFGICVILVTLSCFLAMMKMAAQIKDRFYQLIVYGTGVMYIFQIFLTVGGGINLIPLTGVTLPLISYGGSSVMSTMITFFIIQGIYIRLQQKGKTQSGRKAKKPSEKNSQKTGPRQKEKERPAHG